MKKIKKLTGIVLFIVFVLLVGVICILNRREGCEYVGLN